MAKGPLITVKYASLKTDDGQNQQVQVDHLRRTLARFNHDLRQPLQTMDLLCGVLASKVKEPDILKVVHRLEDVLGSVSEMLDTVVSLEHAGNRDYPEYTASVPAPPDHHSVAPPAHTERKPRDATVFVVDDDREVREVMTELLRSHGYTVESFGSSEEFLCAYASGRKACILIDALLPGMSGLDLLKKIKERRDPLTPIMITGSGDIALAVNAMKTGAADFIEKPVNAEELLSLLSDVTQQVRPAPHSLGDRTVAIERLSHLSARERQVMDLVLEGHPNKNIAADLGISQRTVETHRANIMKKMGAKSLPALLRLTLAAA